MPSRHSFVDDECEISGEEGAHSEEEDQDPAIHTSDGDFIEDGELSEQSNSFYNAIDNAESDDVDGTYRLRPNKKRRRQPNFRRLSRFTSHGDGKEEDRRAPDARRRHQLIHSESESEVDSRTLSLNVDGALQQDRRVGSQDPAPVNTFERNPSDILEILETELYSVPDVPNTYAMMNSVMKIRTLWRRTLRCCTDDLNLLCLRLAPALAQKKFTEDTLQDRTNVNAYARYIETLYAVLSDGSLAGVFRSVFFQNQPRDLQCPAETNVEPLELLDPEIFRGSILLPDDGTRDEMVQKCNPLRLLIKQHMQGHFGCTIISDNGGKETEFQYPQPPCTTKVDTKNVKKPCQLLLNFVLNTAYNKRFRKSADGIYEQAGIRYFKFLCEFTDFVWRCVGGQAQNPQEFAWATHGKHTVADTVNSLENLVNEARLPTIQWHRTFFSFRNGVLNADGMVFYWDVVTFDRTRYIRTEKLSDLDATIICPGYFDRDYPVEYHLRNDNEDFPFDVPPLQTCSKDDQPEEIQYLQILPSTSPELQAFLNQPKFDRPVFEADRENFFDPMDIPTPSWDLIMDTQNWDKPTKFMFCFSLGRTVFPIGYKDGLQILPYWWGVPGVGKSIMLEQFRKIYDGRHVGTLMSDVEPVFCDGHLVGKFIAIFPDLVRNRNNQCALNEGRLKNYATGETIMCYRKHKTPVQVQWSTNTIIASNYSPPWSDVAMVRRLLIFMMEHPVARGDATLDKQCGLELDLFLLKCLFAYHWGVRIFGSFSNILSAGVMPDHIMKGSREYTRNICILQSFLDSEHVQRGPGYEIDFKYLNDYVSKYAKTCSKELQQQKNFKYNPVEHNPIIQQNPGITLIYENGEPVGLKGVRLTEDARHQLGQQ